ncbi:hypothetical protein VM98_37715, partial [Streptomyces rubellomurinus subsp. indigoferus]
DDMRLRVVGFQVAGGLVPDRDGESGERVGLSAGSWTAAELSGLAGGCADAGHEVVGGVGAGAVRERTGRTARSGGRPPEGAEPARALGAEAGRGAGWRRVRRTRRR